MDYNNPNKIPHKELIIQSYNLLHLMISSISVDSFPNLRRKNARWWYLLPKRKCIQRDAQYFVTWSQLSDFELNLEKTEIFELNSQSCLHQFHTAPLPSIGATEIPNTSSMNVYSMIYYSVFGPFWNFRIKQVYWKSG